MGKRSAIINAEKKQTTTLSERTNLYASLGEEGEQCMPGLQHRGEDEGGEFLSDKPMSGGISTT